MTQDTKDIESRKDLEQLIDAFYTKVLADDTIGYIFTKVARLDIEKHLPLMYDFWETTLFHKAIYKGNPMDVHMRLNKKEPLQKAHFDRWITLFEETVDELFRGARSEQAKNRARSIATVMQLKIYQAK